MKLSVRLNLKLRHQATHKKLEKLEKRKKKDDKESKAV
jgi:hypothetical protein